MSVDQFKIRLRTILDTVSSPIFVKNNDHQIILANTSFCDFFALDIKDVLGKTLAETVPEDEKVHFLAIDRMVLDTGNPSTIEETITFAGKPTRKIVTNKTRFTEISGTHFLVGSIHDVTALRESERSLAQASKLASLGELAAGIAHEINNPLAIILGSVSLLAKYRDNPEKSASKIEAVQKSCDRIARIVSGLKKFSRSGEAASFRTHSLSDIAKEVLVLTESKSKRHLTPVMLECLTQAQILCDEVEIEQVLVNLINNGIDAVKSRAEKWVKISIVEDGPAVVLRVMDSGPGIPESVCAKLYDPFFTTKKVGEGTGLGLSITKGILTAHGATITVVAECPNTCFEIRFSKAEALKFAA